MDNQQFKIRLNPKDAYALLKKGLNYDELYQSEKVIDEMRSMIVSVYEIYFFRNSSRAGLTVTIDNIDGTTEVNAVPSGSSQGAIFNFDWGAGNNMTSKVREIFKEYIYESDAL